jgi:hypothetical protein
VKKKKPLGNLFKDVVPIPEVIYAGYNLLPFASYEYLEGEPLRGLLARGYRPPSLIRRLGTCLECVY